MTVGPEVSVAFTDQVDFSPRLAATWIGSADPSHAYIQNLNGTSSQIVSREIRTAPATLASGELYWNLKPLRSLAAIGGGFAQPPSMVRCNPYDHSDQARSVFINGDWPDWHIFGGPDGGCTLDAPNHPTAVQVITGPICFDGDSGGDVLFRQCVEVAGQTVEHIWQQVATNVGYAGKTNLIRSPQGDYYSTATHRALWFNDQACVYRTTNGDSPDTLTVTGLCTTWTPHGVTFHPPVELWSGTVTGTDVDGNLTPQFFTLPDYREDDCVDIEWALGLSGGFVGTVTKANHEEYIGDSIYDPQTYVALGSNCIRPGVLVPLGITDDNWN